MGKYITVGVLCLIGGLYVATTEYRIQDLRESVSVQTQINDTLITELTRQKDLTNKQSEAIIAVHNRTLKIETFLSSK